MSADLDCDFQQAQSGASESYPIQCSALRKNGFVLIKGEPVKIVEMSTSKTGKHGHAKVHMVGIGIFDGKKLEDICPSTHNMNVPNVNRKEWQLVDIDDEGYLNLMDDSGDCREDLKAGDDKLADEIKAKFDDGEDVFVTVLSAMGREKVIACKTGNK